MQAENLTLNVQTRNTLKKSDLKKLRKQNMVPACIYGLKQKNLSISLDVRLAKKFSTKEYENKIFTLESKDKGLSGLKVIKKDVSIHPIRREPIHMDFLSLDMSRSIRVQVEIRFKGKPKGVREEGGIFNTILRNLEVECLPQDIPSFVLVDVTELNLNENLHVSDLKLPEKVKLITKPTSTLCTVVEAAEEAEASTTPAATADAKTDDKDKTPEKKEGVEASPSKPENKK